LEYLKENGVTFPVILDPSITTRSFIMSYQTLGMTAVPLSYLIGRDGKVIDCWYGKDDRRADKAMRKLGLMD
jgi:peroxiredoxin